MSQRADSGQSVGIVSGSQAAVREIESILAGEGVSLSRTIGPEESPSLLAGLKTLQRHRQTELLILAADPAPPATVQELLAQVRASDKPTVVCLLGANPRLVWQAGAIPARRLDEAARRASAWVQGLDQALISSQLQADDDELAAQARRLRRRLKGRGGQVACLLSAETFWQEARLMLGELAPGVELDWRKPGKDRLARLRATLAAPGGGTPAVVLLDITVDAPPLDPSVTVEAVADILRPVAKSGPVAIVRLCQPPSEAATRAAAVLRASGACVAASNAAAARLAAFVQRS